MHDEQGLTFPDGPRSELDRSLSQLVENAQQVLATQGRLRSLLKASRVVADELELPVVLRRIIEAAVEMVGARYGAIGVIAPDGSLEQFIHVGLSEELAAHIGHLPAGHGLLGALIEEQEPIRLDHLAEDPRSSGLPPGHPSMESFLGVPVRVRGAVYGNLYLTEREGGFSAEDQELVVSLAATAGAAIDHARLFDESRRRQHWTAASAEVTAALLSDQADDSLAVLAELVAQLADADLVCVVASAGETLRIDVARGASAEQLQGTVFEAAGTIAGRAMEGGQPVLADTAAEGDQVMLGPTMVVPITPGGEPIGVLTVSRAPGRPRFTTSDLDMVADFAAQASVALKLASARSDRQRLAVLEDRSRIARDLHDHVIQRLFGAGLALQSIAATTDAAARTRIGDQVDALDAAIADIRTAIFTMTAQPDSERPTLRHRVIDLVGELTHMFPSAPRLTFTGPVDLMVPVAMADDIIAVVREGLANVARHAQAEHSWVAVAVTDGIVTVEVQDDGRGVDPTAARSSGTANMAARAAVWGGSVGLQPRDPRGTALAWTAPIGTS